MKRKLYMVLGYKEKRTEATYPELIFHAKKLGFDVTVIEMDWKRNLFEVIKKSNIEEDSVVFGFSIGGLVAEVIGTLYDVKVIRASGTPPDHNFKRVGLVRIGKENVDFILGCLVSKTRMVSPMIKIRGAKEHKSVLGDIEVKNTGHRFNKTYCKTVLSILKVM